MLALLGIFDNTIRRSFAIPDNVTKKALGNTIKYEEVK